MEGSLRNVVPRGIRERYALKFMIALFVLAATIAAVGLVGTSAIADEADAQTRQDSIEIAQKEAEQLAAETEYNQLQANRLTAELAQRESAEIDPYLEAQHQQIEGNHHIHYVDVVNGTILNSTNEELRGQPISATDARWGEEFGDMGTEIYENRSIYGGYRTEWLPYYTTPIADQASDGTNVMNYHRSLGPGADRGKLLIMGQNMSARATVLSDEAGRVSYLIDEESTVNGKAAAPHGEIVLAPGETALYEPYVNEKNFNMSNVTSNGSVYDIGNPGDALASSVGEEYEDQEYVATAIRMGDSQFILVLHTPKSQAYGFSQTINEYGVYATFGGVALIVFVGGVIGRNTSRSITRLREKARQMENGDLDVELTSPRVDSIGQLYDGFDSMRNSLKRQIREAEAAREDAEEARTETERMNQHLERKAEDYRAVMEQCAEGDLTQRLDPESENEAMTDIALAFNSMIEELEATTAFVKDFATEVASASEEVTASSEEVRSASHQVSESVQEISKGAEKQNTNLQSIASEIEELSTSTEEIAAASSNVADIAEETAESGRVGREAAQEAIDGMHEIESESMDTIEAIESLEAEIERIDEMAEFISELAHQTNMLALNANIEASRGGVGGDGDGDSSDGFAVVASEVKELAADTKEAAQNIEERIERINDRTEHTTTEVQQTADKIANHTDSVRNAADALDEIAGYAEETNNGVQEISTATEQQAASTQEVVAMVSEVNDISDRTAEEAEDVAAAAEEQTAAISEVSVSASSLTDQAARLSETLDNFETDRESDVTAPDATVEDETSAVDGASDDVSSGDGGTDELASDGESSDDGSNGQLTDREETGGGADSAGDIRTDANVADGDTEPAGSFSFTEFGGK